MRSKLIAIDLIIQLARIIWTWHKLIAIPPERWGRLVLWNCQKEEPLVCRLTNNYYCYGYTKYTKALVIFLLIRKQTHYVILHTPYE